MRNNKLNTLLYATAMLTLAAPPESSYFRRDKYYSPDIEDESNPELDKARIEAAKLKREKKKQKRLDK